ncbi:MAG: GCN5-related N-acetyltransferase [Deltaproteobacteria bacterium]|nr:GCN5-related N-acetyltransferase [Deltaproteobacteria bacterium]
MALFMDQLLARRLERAEASVAVSFVGLRQVAAPALEATWRDFEGTYAIYDGADSPFTQTFGLGLFAPLTTDALSEIERFFAERGAAAVHEVSPLAGIETFTLLADRGYRPLELGSVLVQEIDGAIEATAVPGFTVRMCEDGDRATWVEASSSGWSHVPEIAPFTEIAIRNQAMAHFLVERDGRAIATGSLGIHDDVALLAGASTIPSARGLGAQGMLLGARLVEARRRGCTVALMVATPGTTSQRNAERRGFRVAYTRTKWRRDLAKPIARVGAM